MSEVGLLGVVRRLGELGRLGEVGRLDGMRWLVKW